MREGGREGAGGHSGGPGGGPTGPAPLGPPRPRPGTARGGRGGSAGPSPSLFSPLSFPSFLSVRESQRSPLSVQHRLCLLVLLLVLWPFVLLRDSYYSS